MASYFIEFRLVDGFPGYIGNCRPLFKLFMLSCFQSDLASVREQFESDFLIWRREHEAAFKIREVEKENTVRNQCRMERDKQIDDIIAKVDAEALKTQKDFDSKLLLVA